MDPEIRKGEAKMLVIRRNFRGEIGLPFIRKKVDDLFFSHPAKFSKKYLSSAKKVDGLFLVIRPKIQKS
jgi:hypothetical protein